MSQRSLPTIAALASLVATSIVLSLNSPSESAVPLNVPDGQSIRGLTLSHTDRFAALWIDNGPRKVDYRIEVVATYSGAKKLSFHSLYPRLVTFSRSDRYLAILDVLSLTVIDLTTREPIFSIPNTELDHRIDVIAFSTDETAITTAGMFGQPVRQPHSWRLDSAVALPSQPEVENWCGSTVSPDKSRILSGGWPGPIPRISDSVEEPACRFVPDWHFPWQIACGFTPDSKGFFSIHEDGAVCIYRFSRSSGRSIAERITFRHVQALTSARGTEFMNTRQAIAYVDVSNTLRTVSLSR